jgi:hypothetical protein
MFTGDFCVKGAHGRCLKFDRTGLRVCELACGLLCVSTGPSPFLLFPISSFFRLHDHSTSSAAFHVQSHGHVESLCDYRFPESIMVLSCTKHEYHDHPTAIKLMQIYSLYPRDRMYM